MHHRPDCIGSIAELALLFIYLPLPLFFYNSANPICCGMSRELQPKPGPLVPPSRPYSKGPLFTPANLANFPHRIKKLPPDANVKAAANTKLYQFQKKVSFACFKCRRDNILSDTLAMDRRQQIVLCAACFTRLIRPRTYRPNRIVPFPSLLSWLDYRPAKAAPVATDVMERAAEAVMPSGDRVALPEVSTAGAATRINALPAVAMNIASAKKPNGSTDSTHPCCRVWGSCKHGPSCMFRNAPADLCLGYLMGICQGDSRGCRLKHLEVYDLPLAQPPSAPRHEGDTENSDTLWGQWVAERQRSPNAAEWQLWNNGSLNKLLDVFVPPIPAEVHTDAPVELHANQINLENAAWGRYVAHGLSRASVPTSNAYTQHVFLPPPFRCLLLPSMRCWVGLRQSCAFAAAGSYSRGLHACPRRLSPRLPPSRPPVDPTAPTVAGALHSASLVTREAFTQRLYGFSRSNFDETQSDAAFVQLQELLQHRMTMVSPKVLHEHMHLAFVSRFHQLAVDIFYRSIQVAPQMFMLSEYVVDAAYALESSTDLTQMALYAAAKMTETSKSGAGRELMAEFSLLRILWRLMCLYEHACSEEARGVHVKCPPGQYATDAERVYQHIVSNFPPQSTASTILFSFFRRLTQRLIKYDRSGDDGEMMFYRECYSRRLLPAPVSLPVGGGADSTFATDLLRSAKTSPMLAADITETELFYATLIGTCIAGRHVSAATSYYEGLRHLFGIGASSSPTAQIAEFVVYRLLSVLQANRENAAITQLARRLLAEGSPISISVWSVILVSAGETRAADVALHAYQFALEQLERNQASADQRGNEYLLQTALNALSKCQVPDFEAKYLQAARDAGALHCTDEFFAACLLQEAHNSTDPINKARAIRRRITEDGVPMTARLVSRFLKIYLRAEDSEYLPTYQYATGERQLFRRPWLDGLLLWADRRRYALTPTQRKYILQEVRLRLGPNAKEHLGGLRTQHALLEYDTGVQPCEYFMQHHKPPPEPPSVQDPRVHFLVRRPSNTARGILGSTDRRIVAGGDPQRRAVAARVALLSCRALAAADGDAGSEAFRVFLVDVLSGLQRCDNFVS
eukprot:gene7199-5059_t